MSDHDRDRDSGSGRFVTDEYAEQHPDTTVSEDVRDPVKAALRSLLDAYDETFSDPDQARSRVRLDDAIEVARALV